MTMLLCIACFFCFIFGVHDSWSWWILALLALGTVVFFFAESEED
jgi:hypothetical protein